MAQAMRRSPSAAGINREEIHRANEMLVRWSSSSTAEGTGTEASCATANGHGSFCLIGRDRSSALRRPYTPISGASRRRNLGWHWSFISAMTGWPNGQRSCLARATDCHLAPSRAVKPDW